jgi:acyl-coenzyme A thioesterase PaaI-like protein
MPTPLPPSGAPPGAETVPYARLTGIRRDAHGHLELPYVDAVHNHLGTVHASAQMALAETAAGALLQDLFPELAGRVLPVVRAARGKFRAPASSTLRAYPSLDSGARAAFLELLEARGRAGVTVEVELRDMAGAVTLRAAFDWFVQRLDPPTAGMRDHSSSS